MKYLLLAAILTTTACASDPAASAPAPAPDAGTVTAPDAAPVTATDAAPAVLYPAPDWPVDVPENHALDRTHLDEAATAAESNGSRCLLVIRHGVLVYERYFAGATAASTHKSWSLAKSYSATLVGIAIDRGDIHSLTDRVSDYVTEWRGTPRDAITVRDLVSMTSGLKWSAFQDYVQMAVFADDHTNFATALPLAKPPATEWLYHNGAVQMLEPLFRAATGMTIEAYAQQHLWSRIGMTSATWSHDDMGHPTPYANVLATCRDHARLGYLYLHRGKWGSSQILSESWVRQALTPSQQFNRAYGFLFWLNGGAPAINAMNEKWPSTMVPYAPADLFAARGFGNQFIDVIPSLDLVIVRFGEDPATGLDISALTTDAKFEKHDQILRPILAAIR